MPILPVALLALLPVASAAPPAAPAYAWAGTWDFPRMALQLAVVEKGGSFVVTATNTKKAGHADMPCDPVTVSAAGELTCTIHGVDGRQMPIRLRPVEADPARFGSAALSVGGYVVDTGARFGTADEPVSEP